MMKILDIGMNHTTAPVELRERLSFSGDSLDSAIKEIMDIRDVREALILSTCNRIEVIFTTDKEQDARDSVIGFLSRHSGIEREKLLSSLYIKSGSDAVRHIFRVSASLDSMIVGEPQILGQVKEAYRSAGQRPAYPSLPCQ